MESRLMSGNQASTGQLTNGRVGGLNGDLSSILLGRGSGDGDDSDPPDERSSKLPRRWYTDIMYNKYTAFELI